MKNSVRIFLKFIMAIGFFIGLAILFYPLFSNKWNQYNEKLKFQEYQQIANEKFVDEGLIEEWEKARAYNDDLQPIIIPDSFIQTEGMTEEDKTYLSCLNIHEDGMMGYIYLPKIGERIPIYHTTSEDVLQKGAGHIQGSSLPVGGEGTHAAIAAHRGLPGASLFTDLDQLEEGDQFYLYILDDVLAYEIDQILTVEPSDTEPLGVEPDKDYVTLVTCTPYGVNSHRLLVRGHRVPYEEEQVAIQETKVVQSVHTNYTMWILLGLGITAVCMGITLIIVRFVGNRRMEYKWNHNLILLLAILSSLLLQKPLQAYAANVDTAADCSVSFVVPAAYRSELVSQELFVRLYRIADITEYGRYADIPGYEDLQVSTLSEQTTAEQLKLLAQKAATHLQVSEWEEIPEMTPDYELTISNNEGNCSDMRSGLYLVCVKTTKVGNATYHALPYIISLPTLIETGNGDAERELTWVYDLEIDLKLKCERQTVTPTPKPTNPPVPIPSPEVTPDPVPQPEVTPDPTPLPTLTPSPTITPSPTPYPSPYIVEEDGVLWEYFYDENGVLGRRRVHRTGDDASLPFAAGGAIVTGGLCLIFVLLDKKHKKKEQPVQNEEKKTLRSASEFTEKRFEAGKWLGKLFGIGFVIFLLLLLVISIRYYSMRQHNTEIESRVIRESVEEFETLDTGMTGEMLAYCEENRLPLVDFAALKAINEDCVAWIYACGGEISYPVVISNDEYYLSHAIDGTEAKSGAIYVDSLSKQPFESGRAVVYGHHMRDGSMFKPLVKYWQDKNYRDEEKNIYIITEAAVYVYEISQVYVKEYEDIEFLQAGPLAEADDTGEAVIDLITCQYSGIDTRLVVEAVQKEIYQ